MAGKVVAVVGGTGYLGLQIVKALLGQGARVKAIIRDAGNRAKLESLGVSDFAIGDMMDRESLKAALSQSPRAEALVASAAGYTRHAPKDSPRTDTEGYRNLVDACKETGLPRFVLISILESDKAAKVPHFYHKYLTEEYLKKVGQPYIALRAGAFLDQAQDRVLAGLKNGIYPAFFPEVALGMVYTPDLARYAALAATNLPDTALGRSIDIGWETPASAASLAQAFSKMLGKPIVAKPAFPPFASKVMMPLMGLFSEGPRDMSAMMKWVGSGVYVSHNPQAQKEFFGELPSVEEAVRRYCKDRGLV